MVAPPSSAIPPPAPAGFDPFDPDVDPPRRALTPDQVRYCKEALKVFEEKLTQEAEIYKEFGTLPDRKEVNKKTEKFTVAHDPANYQERNRHDDVLPFDENRVRLQSPTGNDYISASLIETDGGDQTKFICAQCPIENTFQHFWQMVYENFSPVIVMVAPFDSIMCDDYLQLNKGRGDHREIDIKITKKRQDGDLVLRDVEIQWNEVKINGGFFPVYGLYFMSSFEQTNGMFPRTNKQNGFSATFSKRLIRTTFLKRLIGIRFIYISAYIRAKNIIRSRKGPTHIIVAVLLAFFF